MLKQRQRHEAQIVLRMKSILFVALLCAVAVIVKAIPQRYRDKFVFSQVKSFGSGKYVKRYDNVTEGFVNTAVDHFDVHNSNTFKQRYFADQTYWSMSETAPVFLCVGGEGPPLDKSVLVASAHCNDMVEIAGKYGALLLALEHRYYGVSMPNVGDYSTENLLYLSTEQALEDIANFHSFAVKEFSLSSSNRWVTFGGSYPGMMAAMARLRFPHLFFASISSSSPLQAIVNFPGYNDVVAESMANPLVGGSDACLSVVVEGHKQVGEKLTSAAGRRELETTFNFCKPLTLEDPKNREQFAGDGVVYLPIQGNDPSCTSNLCNIDKICTFLVDPTVSVTPMQRLADLSAAMSPACTSVSYDTMMSFWSSPQNPDRSWLYQTCSEWGFYQTCDAGTQCPYTQGLHSLSVDLDICEKAFALSPSQVTQNIDNANSRYGGSKNFQATRVMFPNGQVDPWKAGGVLTSPAGSIEEPTLMVAGASHHFWTHPTLPTDSAEVVAARQAIWSQLDKWLSL